MLDDIIGDSTTISSESDIIADSSVVQSESYAIGDSSIAWLESDVIDDSIVTVVSGQRDGDAIECPDLWSSVVFHQGCLIISDRQPWA